ncbi:carbohydrate kinase family protein [Winogradskyella poriferorum]|uniref:carbohydrate kinase family protein n=1 Tax=Winogradskyella poriferorum TaxID=307627 RepID=UPI003D66083A
MSSITCFGEVLWDVFPTHKNIGGAPLNVAIRLASFGNNVNVISCVGDDADGTSLVDYMNEHDVNTFGVQISPNLKTSCVLVALDETGSATYTIEKPCAWDEIQISDILKSITISSDVFIFGSLSIRSITSKTTLLALLNEARFKVFDVNLRKPHYKMGDLIELMTRADLIKFNDEEIIEIGEYFNFESDDMKELIEFISKKTNTEQICVTLGSKGALFYDEGNFLRNNGYSVKVKDTVGAGDSFLATLVDGILNHFDNQSTLNRACAVGAIVASKEGATPKVSQLEIEQMLKS